MTELTLAAVAQQVGGRLVGDGGIRVRGVAPLESAGPGDLSFVASPRYLPYVQTTAAAAVLVRAQDELVLPAHLAQIEVRDPRLALAALLPLFHPPPELPVGVDPTAVIEPGAEVGDGVYVGPYAVLRRGARVGSGSRIDAHVVVGAGCVIGEGCTLHPHVTLYPGAVLGDRCILHSGVRIGTDGYGYIFADGEHRKVPQVGGCRIGDDVEIGANSTVDRGSIGDTIIGRGTKVDNLVHIAHNVRVGEHVLIIAQVGVSGSTTIGDGAVLAGQAGIGGHLEIGAGARVAGQAGVIGDVPAGATVSGYPARPHREALRASAALLRLPELLRRIARIESRLPGAERPVGAVPPSSEESSTTG